MLTRRQFLKSLTLAPLLPLVIKQQEREAELAKLPLDVLELWAEREPEGVEVYMLAIERKESDD